MSTLFQETVLGRLVHYFSKSRLLKYPEQRPSFVYPVPVPSRSPSSESVTPTVAEPASGDMEALRTGEQPLAEPKVNPNVVTWYSADDPDNPQNWPLWKKRLVATIIGYYTFAVYSGSSLSTSGFSDLSEQFGLSLQVVTLTVSIYVLFYGVGAMIFSPLSEIPYLGRNPFYVLPMVLFTCLQVGAALTPTFPGLVVLRGMTAFLGAPILATGGATLADMYSPADLLVVLCFWVFPAFCAPAFAPVIGNFAVDAHGWRWSMWELLWLVGALTVLITVLLPETYGPNILHRRAQRLRKLTGNKDLRTQCEIDGVGFNMVQQVKQAVFRPFLITVLDPSIGFANLYIGLVYAFYYCFFDSFPIVFLEIYHFSEGTEGLAYLSIALGAIIGIVIHLLWQWFYLDPFIKAHGWPVNEKRLEPAIISALLAPVGLYIFAWTARPSVHWTACMAGTVIFVAANFVTLNALFFYIAISYTHHSASLFAANDFFRASLAVAMLHAGIPLFEHLGIGRGMTVLASLTCLGIPGVFLIHHYGAFLRSKSRFTG